MGKKTRYNPECNLCPPTDLHDHPFYGLKLDAEQEYFRDCIYNPDKKIIFSNSKAGTGKTLITLATADLMVHYGMYDRIVWIYFPAEEHVHGYLPGDLESKSLPYMTPLSDAMIKLGINPNTALANNMLGEKYGGYIYFQPDTFLRGVNLSRCIVVADEFQNTDRANAKRLLTRIHDDSKVIIIGHTGQQDTDCVSGFLPYMDWFKDDERTAICPLTTNHRGWVAQHADEMPADYEAEI